MWILRATNATFGAFLLVASKVYLRMSARRARVDAMSRLTPGDRVVIFGGVGIDRVLNGYTGKYSGTVGTMAKVVLDHADHYSIVDPRSLCVIDSNGDVSWR